MATDGEHYLIEIPDLNKFPYVIAPVVLNNKTYYFEYKWNIREQKAYLAIYILINNTKKYLLRSIGLSLYNNIAKYIFDVDNWSGELYFKPVNLDTTSNYNQQNISTNYELSYVPI